MNRVLAKKLLRDLSHRAGMLAALVAVIAVGVAVFVAMASAWRDLDAARDAYYRGARIADFWVDLRRAPVEAVDIVRKMPGVRDARGRVHESVVVTPPGRGESLPGTAISMPLTRRPVLNDVQLRSGIWFSGRGDREVILNDAFARANRLAPGDHIDVLLADRRHRLRIVGTAMSPEFVYLIPPDGGLAPDPARFAVLYLPEPFLQRASALDGAFNQIVGTAHDLDPTAMSNLLTAIAGRLDAYGVALTTPASEQASVRFLRDELEGLRVQARVMPALFLGVAALVLNVLIARLVAQQRTTVGTLRAIGYGRGAIGLHYASFGLVVGAFGAITGVLLGFWLQERMVALYADYYALPALVARAQPDLALAGAAICIAFAVAGTIKGVVQTTRLQPADAMRPPPPERGGRILLERIGVLWRMTGFRTRLVLRTVFRNPYRSAVSVIASTVAGALVFCAFSMSDSLDHLMRYEFERVSHQDVTIALRETNSRAALRETARLAGVTSVEARLGISSLLRTGSRAKRVAVIGVARENRLFTPLDDAGQPIAIPERGLVLAEKLAEILGVSPGDTLTFRPLSGRRVETTTVVAATVRTYLGLAAYADQRYLSRLIGETDAVNAVLVTTRTRRADPALRAALDSRAEVVGIGERTRALTQLQDTFGETMGAMIAIMVLFAGLIAFGSVLNATLVALGERQRDVGTFRVLGYSPLEVASLFVGESVLLNLLGIAAGLGAGIGLAELLSRLYSTELYRFPAVVSARSLVTSAVLMAAFVALAQWLVLRAIRRLDWLAVLNAKE